MKNKYFPRNDFVILEFVNLGMTEHGVILPDASREGKEFRIRAIGPNNTKDLRLNDSVLISESVDTFPLPNDPKFFAVRQDSIALVIKDRDKE